VVAIARDGAPVVDGVRLIAYSPTAAPVTGERDVEEFAASAENGLAVAAACERLKSRRFEPDLVLGHSGWGETLFVKDVWPQARLLSYFEFFYRSADSDADFDPEFPLEPYVRRRLRLRNAVNALALQSADWGQTPTKWQRAQYPEREQDRIAVLHEGVDSEFVRPNRDARIWLSGGVSLGVGDPIVTFCARNLEPYRGFHVFMRALPEIQRRVPDARVVVLGADGVSYGRLPEAHTSWREAMRSELGDAIDLSRVHFLGLVPFRQYLSILQVSAAHIYLTYPFVLSWSLIEALSAGCLIVGSNTGPVREAIEDGMNGWLVDFFDPSALADRVVEALTRPDAGHTLRARARATALERFDLRSVCLPKHIGLWEQLIGRRLTARPRRTG